MARPHHLLRLFGAAAMGHQGDEPRHRRQPVGAERGRGSRTHQGVGQGPHRRDHRRRVRLARSGAAWLDEDEATPKGLEAVLEDRVKLGAVTLNEMRDTSASTPTPTPPPTPDGAHRDGLCADRGGCGGRANPSGDRDPGRTHRSPDEPSPPPKLRMERRRKRNPGIYGGRVGSSARTITPISPACRQAVPTAGSGRAR